MAADSLANRAAELMFSLHTESHTPASMAVQLGQTSAWEHLRDRFRMQEVNVSLVREHERKFANAASSFNRIINRSRPYMYHIVTEVQKRGMPAEIALLPFIESAYVTRARSHVGASGLWQFMPATGRHFGLEQTPLYDGRHDIYAATDAALNYLNYLYGLFGDWSLALAAYNWGEGNLSRAIRNAQAAGLVPTYENLRMPAETRNYVPKLLAVRNIIMNPARFGINLPEMRHEPYFKAVSVSNPLDITAAARLANISESEFLALNPAFKTPVFLPKGEQRKMLLPISAAKTFEQNYRNAENNQLLSWDIFTPYGTMRLSDVAAQTGTSVADLKRLNGITGNTVAAGSTLLVNKGGISAQQAFLDFSKVDHDHTPDNYQEIAPVLGPTASKQPTLKLPENRNNASTRNITTTARNNTSNNKNQNNRTPATHRVVAGDTLYSIAQRYRVDINDLKAANLIVGNSIRNGQILKIANIKGAAQQKTPTRNQNKNNVPKTYTVKKGDTLASIAARYNLKVNDLKRLNGNSSKLQIGQRIRLN